MLVYRIVHKRYADSLFASGLEGRWNSEGKKVLYTAESISLAYLETLAHRKGLGFNKDFKIISDFFLTDKFIKMRRSE